MKASVTQHLPFPAPNREGKIKKKTQQLKKKAEVLYLGGEGRGEGNHSIKVSEGRASGEAALENICSFCRHPSWRQQSSGCSQLISAPVDSVPAEREPEHHHAAVSLCRGLGIIKNLSLLPDTLEAQAWKRLDILKAESVRFWQPRELRPLGITVWAWKEQV